MVKFTSTAVAASIFAGSALAAPSFSRSDNGAVTAREIEMMFGREMVEYAARSPVHLHEVVHVVNAVNKITNNDRREYVEALAARQDPGDGTAPVAAAEPAPAPVVHTHPHTHTHDHTHPHTHNGPHTHTHNHPHSQGAGIKRRSYGDYSEFEARSYDDYYNSLAARQDPGDGTAPVAAAEPAPAPVVHTHPHTHTHDHTHPHTHNGPHTHNHPHSQGAGIKRRSIDFDELYTRYVDFDDLD